MGESEAGVPGKPMGQGKFSEYAKNFLFLSPKSSLGLSGCLDSGELTGCLQPARPLTVVSPRGSFWIVTYPIACFGNYEEGRFEEET